MNSMIPLIQALHWIDLVWIVPIGTVGIIFMTILVVCFVKRMWLESLMILVALGIVMAPSFGG